ncbi:MAG: hypothetical protein ACXVFO_10935 [Solirubrobacteraceae bacterium]
MTDAAESLKIAEFEHVAAGPAVMLLRVRAGVPAAGQGPDQRPQLVAEHDGGLQRFAALPSPPDPPGVLRAAYSVPPTLIAPETTFTLELGDGTLVALPAPTAGTARRPAAPLPAEGGGPAAPLPADVGSPTAPLPSGGPEAEDAELSARLAELEIWSGELERRLADTTDQLADARARLATAELDALSTRAEAEALQQAARELAEARSRA